jgi:hypothetical protein
MKNSSHSPRTNAYRDKKTHKKKQRNYSKSFNKNQDPHLLSKDMSNIEILSFGLY